MEQSLLASGGCPFCLVQQVPLALLVGRLAGARYDTTRVCLPNYLYALPYLYYNINRAVVYVLCIRQHVIMGERLGSPLFLQLFDQ